MFSVLTVLPSHWAGGQLLFESLAFEFSQTLFFSHLRVVFFFLPPIVDHLSYGCLNRCFVSRLLTLPSCLSNRQLV